VDHIYISYLVHKSFNTLKLKDEVMFIKLYEII